MRAINNFPENQQYFKSGETFRRVIYPLYVCNAVPALRFREKYHLKNLLAFHSCFGYTLRFTKSAKIRFENKKMKRTPDLIYGINIFFLGTRHHLSAAFPTSGSQFSYEWPYTREITDKNFTLIFTARYIARFNHAR